MVARFLDRTDAQLLAWTLITKVAVLAIGYVALSAAIGGTRDFLIRGTDGMRRTTPTSRSTGTWPTTRGT